MHLVHVIPNLKSGGAESFLLRLSNSLIADFKQTIFTFSTSKGDQLYNRFNENISFLFKKNDLIDYLIQKENVIIICWMYPSIFYIENLLSKNKINVNVIWNIRHSKFRYFQIKQKLGLLYLAFISRIKKRNIIYCAFTSRDYHQNYFFYRKNAVVINNRLTKELKINRSPQEEDYLLYVGRFSHYKGSKKLLQIFESYCKQNKPYKLKIIGAGWENIILSESIKDHIEFVGYTSDLANYYSNAKAFLFTSISEGYPNVLAEACSFGIPIISTNAGDTSKILEEYSFSKIVNSKKEFIKELIQLKSPNQNEMEIEAQKFRTKNNFEATKREYLTYLSNLNN